MDADDGTCVGFGNEPITKIAMVSAFKEQHINTIEQHINTTAYKYKGRI